MARHQIPSYAMPWDTTLPPPKEIKIMNKKSDKSKSGAPSTIVQVPRRISECDSFAGSELILITEQLVRASNALRELFV